MSKLARIPKNIAICADDFGLHPHINQGIIRLIQQEKLSAVSCLVDGIARDLYADELTQSRSIDLGLHLNLTEILAHTPINSRPRMHSIYHWVCGLSKLTLSASALKQEIDRQWRLFETLYGRKPDYIDGHEYVHQMPFVRTVLMQWMQEQAIEKHVWLRSTALQKECTLSWRGYLKAFLIYHLGGKSLCRLAQAQGVLMNQSLFGIYPLNDMQGAYLSYLTACLDRMQNHDLLVVHPASSPEIYTEKPFRYQEYLALQQITFPWKSENNATIMVLQPLSKSLLL